MDTRNRDSVGTPPPDVPDNRTGVYIYLAKYSLIGGKKTRKKIAETTKKDENEAGEKCIKFMNEPDTRPLF